MVDNDENWMKEFRELTTFYSNSITPAFAAKMYAQYNTSQYTQMNFSEIHIDPASEIVKVINVSLSYREELPKMTWIKCESDVNLSYGADVRAKYEILELILVLMYQTPYRENCDLLLSGISRKSIYCRCEVNFLMGVQIHLWSLNVEV